MSYEHMLQVRVYGQLRGTEQQMRPNKQSNFRSARFLTLMMAIQAKTCSGHECRHFLGYSAV
jgi:hypothetical protein